MATAKNSLVTNSQIIRFKAFVKGLKLHTTAIAKLDFKNNPFDQNEIIIRADVMQAELKEITKIIRSIIKEQSKIN